MTNNTIVAHRAKQRVVILWLLSYAAAQLLFPCEN